MGFFLFWIVVVLVTCASGKEFDWVLFFLIMTPFWGLPLLYGYCNIGRWLIENKDKKMGRWIDPIKYVGFIIFIGPIIAVYYIWEKIKFW